MPDVLHGSHLGSADHPYQGLVVSSPTKFTDHRGALSVLEHGRDLGFVARRTFFIAFAPGGPEGMTRAEHATSCNQMLVTLRGRMRLDLDNGTARHSVTAPPLGAAFLVAAGVWRRIVALEPDTLLMVLADASYADTQYFPVPMPDLVAANARGVSA
jgi:hypothetical protein